METVRRVVDVPIARSKHNANTARRGNATKKRVDVPQPVTPTGEPIPPSSSCNASELTQHSSRNRSSRYVDAVSGTDRILILFEVIQGKIVDEHGNPLPESGRAIHPELQFARCMSNRYRSEEFPRCVSCTRRWAGDTCRFQGIRFFLKDDNRNIIGISFIENQKSDGPAMNFPHKWNISLTLEHIKHIKVLLQIPEPEHVNKSNFSSPLLGRCYRCSGRRRSMSNVTKSYAEIVKARSAQHVVRGKKLL